MTIYLFDLDGTLTPPRLPMTTEFETFFTSWAKDKKCFIATGSDFKKVREQVSENALSLFDGIYCSMGNVLWVKGDFVYKNSFPENNELIKELEHYRLTTKYPHQLFSNHIEKRDGMVNFSVLGRNCPYQEREKYFAYDNKYHEREKIRLELLKKFPQYDISIGGMISMDITLKGCGKEQVAFILKEKYPTEKIVFFGDRTFEGGNDYSLAQAVLKFPNTKVVQVSGPKEVQKILGEIND